MEMSCLQGSNVSGVSFNGVWFVGDHVNDDSPFSLIFYLDDFHLLSTNTPSMSEFYFQFFLGSVGGERYKNFLGSAEKLAVWFRIQI